MKPRQLEIFLEVADRLSIRETARQLGVSQPAVTKTLRDLEAEMGVPLVERSVKGVRLTRYGQAFLSRAKLLLADIQRTYDELAQMRDGIGGGVSIGVSASATGILPGAFRAFRSAYPQVPAKISEGILRQLVAELREGAHDFVVVSMSVLPDDDHEFSYVELLSTPFLVCARQRHPLIRCRSLHDLLDAEWLVPPGLTTATSYVQAAFATFGLPMPARCMEGLSYSVALALIGETDVIGMFASQTQASLKRNGIQQIRIKEQLPTVKVYAIKRLNEPLTPVAQKFLDCFHTAARALVLP